MASTRSALFAVLIASAASGCPQSQDIPRDGGPVDAPGLAPGGPPTWLNPDQEAMPKVFVNPDENIAKEREAARNAARD